jgi:hypothetical protein
MFNLKHISTFAFGATNIVMLLIGIVFWNFNSKSAFMWYPFIQGTIGSIINFFGKIAVQNACAKGPAGPASAVMSTNCLLLLGWDGIAKGKILMPTDWVAVACGVVGVVTMTLTE